MNSNSSRAPPPAPLYIPASADRTSGFPSSGSDTAPRSLPDSYAGPGYFSPQDRKVSSGSAGSASSADYYPAKSGSSPTAATKHCKKRSSTGGTGGGGSDKKPQSPAANVYTYCGRHTDQYLLGGWSDVLNGMFKKE